MGSKKGVIMAKIASFNFADGKYTGEYKGGLFNKTPHGRGKHIWADGESYEGDFLNGDLHGEGIYTYADGEKEKLIYDHNKLLQSEPYEEIDPISQSTTNEETLNFDYATLLPSDEALALPERLRKYEEEWWLCSPGLEFVSATCVSADGVVNLLGFYLDSDFFVRPALHITNLKSTSLKIGDQFKFEDLEFEIITEDLAFCLGDIGRCVFSELLISDYDISDVKGYVDEWFDKANK